MFLGKFIRKWRELNLLSTEMVLEETGFDYSVIFKMEQNREFSFKLLTYYISKGFDLTDYFEYLEKGIENEKRKAEKIQ